jgi:hypothetical protein
MSKSEINRYELQENYMGGSMGRHDWGDWVQHADHLAARAADAAEIERLHTWEGLMSLLDEHYPAEVFDGSSGDPGARIVASTREIAQLRANITTKAAAAAKEIDSRQCNGLDAETMTAIITREFGGLK